VKTKEAAYLAKCERRAGASVDGMLARSDTALRAFESHDKKVFALAARDCITWFRRILGEVAKP
jgi:hypothetical protein